MLLSTGANALMEALGDHEAIGVLAGVGFDCLDFSVDEILNGAEDHPLKENGFRAYAEALLDTAEHCGIFFNQAHAVFPSFEEGLGSKNDKLFADTLRSIEIAGVLKARQIVIHPFSHSGDALAENARFFERLAPAARANNLKIAVENSSGWDYDEDRALDTGFTNPRAFTALIDALDPEVFTACLDVGHAEIVRKGAAPDFIRALGRDRLGALHIHDVDRYDRHDLPYLYDIDWTETAAALREISYRGELTFEAGRFFMHFPKELYPAAAALMHRVGRHLIGLIEG